MRLEVVKESGIYQLEDSVTTIAEPTFVVLCKHRRDPRRYEDKWDVFTCIQLWWYRGS
ncbi:hypothetical protein GGGNBK_13990 [Sporosarcina sp. ANT_H38]